LVEVSAHLLIILLDYTPPSAQPGATPTTAPPTAQPGAPPPLQDATLSQTGQENLFKLYISRLHQKEASYHMSGSLTFLSKYYSE